jgi:hypothetical protein
VTVSEMPPSPQHHDSCGILSRISSALRHYMSSVANDKTVGVACGFALRRADGIRYLRAFVQSITPDVDYYVKCDEAQISLEGRCHTGSIQRQRT